MEIVDLVGVSLLEFDVVLVAFVVFVFHALVEQDFQNVVVVELESYLDYFDAHLA